MSDSSHDYDSVKLRVNPDELKGQAKQLEGHSKSIGEHLDDINSTLKGLKLNWAGQTSEEFHDITSRWTQVVTKLFGPPDAQSKDSGKDGELSAEDGVLPALAVGVRRTAGNYAHADQNAKEMFDELLSNLNDTDESAEPQDSVDRNKTAISASYNAQKPD